MGFFLDRQRLVDELRRRSHECRVAFAVSIAQRLLPHYRLFSVGSRWGSIGVVEKALEMAWDSLLGTPPVDHAISATLKECEDNAPDMDEFSAADSALNAVCAAFHALSAVANDDIYHAERAADCAFSVALSSFDMSNLGYDEMMQMLSMWPPVVDEERRQRQLLDRLPEDGMLTPALVEELRSSAMD